MIKNAVLAAALLLGAFAAHPTRVAAAPIQSTFSFSGACTDCTGSGTADLVLTDYTVGQPIELSNFVSFTYNGTDLLAPFTLSATEIIFVGGRIDTPLPGPQDVFLSGAQQDFGSGTDGSWCVGFFCIADYGSQHRWSSAEAVSVPEPLSAALLATPLLAAMVRRRRS